MREHGGVSMRARETCGRQPHCAYLASWRSAMTFDVVPATSSAYCEAVATVPMKPHPCHAWDELSTFDTHVCDTNEQVAGCDILAQGKNKVKRKNIIVQSVAHVEEIIQETIRSGINNLAEIGILRHCLHLEHGPNRGTTSHIA
jgi:hypothetical protein